MADLRAFLRWAEQARGVGVSPFQLTPPDIEEYCSFLKEGKNHAPATVNRRLQALRKFYRMAVEEGWTDSNPADEVSLLSETVSQRSRFLTADDVERLSSAVQRGRRRWVRRDWAIMQAFLGAGLKLSELTHLRLGDLHIEDSPPRLDVRDTTGAPDRSVPLDAGVCEALGNYLADRRALPGVDHLFVNRDGRPLSTRSVQRLLRHYARAAQLSELTTQALRYRYARNAYETSQDPEAVARLLGHRHLATTIRYLRPSPASKETSSVPEG
jgi:site-specific recombinase XerD